MKLQVGIGGQSPDPDAYYSSEYSYDTATARLKTIKGPGLPAGGAVYNYNATSGLLEEVEFKSTSGTLLTTVREYETHRNLVSEIRHRWSTTDTVSRYNYQHDDLGRRTSIVRNQKAFQQTPAAVHHDALDYNTRSELTETLRYDNATHGSTANPATAKNRYYDYDNAANRDSYTLGQGSTPTEYETNGVNQYAATSQPSEAFDYDADGNLTEDGTFVYIWDAENRLTDVVPAASPQNGDKWLRFTYDYAGRRVRKRVYVWNTSEWGEILDHKYIYDGWQVVLELDGQDDDAVLRKFTWGLDVSGLMGAQPSRDREGAGYFQSAGGVGGLLAVSTGAADEDYIYLYDANGNVGQLVAWTNDYGSASGTGWHIDRVAAHYEYDPYGAVVSASSYGSYLADNPYRFSTKPFDDETGLGYWGYRYYSARLGRWFNRDPRSEQGGLNLYQYVQNSVPNAVDPLGLWKLWGHKEITEEAYKNLSCRHSLGCCGDNILIGLKRGVVWTDAPDGVVDLAISYLFGTKNSLAWRTHWGDLVHWHATVGNETTPEQLRQKMLDWIDTNLFLFENTSQPDPPLDEDKALRCVDKYDYIGRFLHTIQDSYSRSHTTRAPDGTILLFQDYKEQDPDKHGVADKDKGSPEWNSAVKATRTILEMLLCSKSSRGDVIAWIRDNPLRLHPDVRLGGTEDEFKPGTNPDDIVIHGP